MHKLATDGLSTHPSVCHITGTASEPMTVESPLVKLCYINCSGSVFWDTG